ncbi:MAG: hypothetical protein WBA68_01045 [Alteraurantiacibacter sp.]
MPYEPYSPNQEQREASFKLVWFGGFVSLMLVVATILGVAAKMEAWAGIIAGSYLIAFAGPNKFDDYFIGLALHGARWACVILGLWLVSLSLVGIFEAAHGVGVSASGARLDESDVSFILPAWTNNAFLLASCCSLAFHAGFLFHHVRGRS